MVDDHQKMTDDFALFVEKMVRARAYETSGNRSMFIFLPGRQPACTSFILYIFRFQPGHRAAGSVPCRVWGALSRIIA